MRVLCGSSSSARSYASIAPSGSSSMSRRASPTRRHVAARASSSRTSSAFLTSTRTSAAQSLSSVASASISSSGSSSVSSSEKRRSHAIERAPRIVPPLVVELGERRQELALRQPVGLRDRRLVGAARSSHARRRRQAIELRPRVAVFRIERSMPGGSRRTPDADRRRASPRAPRSRAESPTRSRDLGREREALLVDGHEVAPVVRALVDRAQDVDDARLVPRQVKELLERRDRLRAGPVRQPAARAPPRSGARRSRPASRRDVGPGASRAPCGSSPRPPAARSARRAAA